MGCGGSSSSPEPSSIESESRVSTRASVVTEATEMSESQNSVAHERLRKLQELDATTKIPFILVELRGNGHLDGFVEICGKDEYGVYKALDQFLTSQWRCKKMDGGDLTVDTPLPFSDVFYRWEGFKADGVEGLSNMGLATMQLVEFMCRTCGWTLGVINGGNVGFEGEFREQQIIFKAPHPMNLVSHHIMIELRSAGYIEVSGDDRKAMDILHTHFLEDWNAKPIAGHEEFSDRYYECGNNVFKERGKTGENNLGLLTAQLCDSVVDLLPGWSLTTINGGNYGEDGAHREQQLVFRWDNHPLRGARHFIVEFREVGFLELNGEDTEGIYDELDEWLKETMGCKDRKVRGESFCHKMYTWKPTDMMSTSAQVTGFFHERGWEMQVCSQGTVHLKGKSECREQQILFRPGSSQKGCLEPHILIELYTGEGIDDLYMRPDKTQVLANQHIRVRQVGESSFAVGELSKFICDYLGGVEEYKSDDFKFFICDVFLSRGLTDNNLGCWTMRVCDFMVDRLGWSFVVCNVCNLGPAGQYREQQLVFRYDGERREIPAVKDAHQMLDWTLFPGLVLPSYWQDEDVLNLRKPFAIMSCDEMEKEALQEIFDVTFKRVLTRDRVYEFHLGITEEMPYQLQVVHAFRCEHADIYRRFMECRKSRSSETVFRTRCMDAANPLLMNRLLPGESYLAHGTNPSSAKGILKTGFSLSHSGKSTGTMFGYGVYLAECVSKSDEYARDDNGGTYRGLMAMLICRCFIGNPYVVHDAGDHIAAAKAAGCDSLVGDREAKVGTYREFIFFDDRQVIPEYAVIYRREYDKDKVPELMRSKTSGFTGKLWQVQLDKGWSNLSPDVSSALQNAERDGVTSFEKVIGGTKFKFELPNKQINLETGKIRKIRPPMRR